MIRLNNGAFVNLLDGNPSTPPTGATNGSSMIAVATPPTNAWLTNTAGTSQATLTDGVGFNISEPTPVTGKYYTLPTKVLNPGANPAFPRVDSYADLAANEKTLFDEPFDHDTNPALERLASEGKERPGTYPVHRTAFLQRLADPDLPYHPIYNPYITIDWMNMDLTVLNGEDDEPVDDPARVDGSGNPAPYTAPIEEVQIAAGFAFQSRYKDGARVSDAPDSQGIVSLATATNRPRYSFTDPTITDVQTGVSIFSSSTAYLIKSSMRVGGFPVYLRISNSN